MTIKFNKLIGATEALRKISNQELEIKKAVEISRLIKKLEEEYKVFQENYSKLVKKYGKLKSEDSGEYEFDKASREKFNAEVEKLMNLDCKIDAKKIEIGDDIRLSASHVIALEDFIKFKE